MILALLEKCDPILAQPSSLSSVLYLYHGVGLQNLIFMSYCFRYRNYFKCTKIHIDCDI